ncbi:Peregrin [Astathelohania contejeani]|uniref:Peregrin n=1 Tax=Astathelohania contejeani TaxID=164912 RepID=A0ABQ7HZ00_9MICR|nr:Peregrin [Thelohania contejeani]
MQKDTSLNDIPREEMSYKEIYKDLSVKKKFKIHRITPVQPRIQTKPKPLSCQKYPIYINDFKNIEYASDAQDTNFLAQLNQYLSSKGVINVTSIIFELIMDRLEKEWYCFQQSLINKITLPFDSDPIPCNICASLISSTSNLLIFCDGCNLCVHQECYGVPYITEEPWFCRMCLFGDNQNIKCKFCPMVGGAYKQTSDDKWGHVLCAKWNTTLTFSNTVFLEPIEDIQQSIKKTRKVPCQVCGTTKGLTLKCSFTTCKLSYHVTCGMDANYYFDQANLVSFCSFHDPRNKQTNIYSDITEGVGKYPQLVEKPDIRPYLKLSEPLESIFLNIKSKKPVISSIMIDRILCNDLCMIDLGKEKIEIVKKISQYWSLKKRWNNGKTFLRGLQLEYGNKRGMEWYNSRSIACYGSKNDFTSKKRKIISSSKKEFSDFVDFINQPCGHKKLNDKYFLWNLKPIFKALKKIFQLIKQTSIKKQQILKIQHKAFLLCHCKDVFIMEEIMDKLVEDQRFKIFQLPVTEEIAPFYFSIIENPMDFSKIKEKIEKRKTYLIDDNKSYTLNDFKKDLNLIISNCMKYNEGYRWAEVVCGQLEESIELLFNSYSGIINDSNDYKDSFMHFI